MNFPPFFIQALSIAGVVIGLELLLYVRRSRPIRGHSVDDRRIKHKVEENNQIMQRNKERD